MQFTIIRDTNTVVMGGVAFEVDCSALPADVHAVQWDGAHGEVEYKLTRCGHCGARSKKGNEVISDGLAYAPLIKAWEAARDAEMARLKAQEEANAAAVVAAEKAKEEAAKAEGALAKSWEAAAAEAAGGADVAGPKS